MIRHTIREVPDAERELVSYRVAAIVPEIRVNQP